MIFAILILAIPAVLGVLAAVSNRLFPEKVTLVFGGATLGLAVFTTVAYVFSTFLPLLASVAVTLLLMVVLIVPFARKKGLSTLLFWQLLPWDPIAVVVLLISLALTGVVAPKLLITRPDGLATGIVNAYGDIAWHMANITLFAEGQTTPPENPSFAGHRLTYPFLTNFLSAMLLKSGASFSVSVNAVALLMIPTLLTLLYCFARELTKDKRAAFLTVLLFLLGGAAFGWVRFGGDWQASGASLAEFITHLPTRDYAGSGSDEQGFHFTNPLMTLLLPQRSFLFALPLAASILLLLLPQQRPNINRYLAAGLTAGVLPLFHAHTALALLPVLVSFFFIDFATAPSTRRQTLHTWMLFALPALIIGIPEVLYYLQGGGEAGSFLRLEPRWLAGERNIIWYWLMNTGLLIPAAVAALFLKRIPIAVKALTVSGLGIFVVTNLFVFAPWSWDNTKLLIYFLVFALPAASLVAFHLLGQKKYPVLRGAIVLLIIMHVLSAGLDIWKVLLPTSGEWNEWDAGAVAFASQVQKNTAAGETVLTATNHNSAIVLAGRPRYLGFAAHVWSHGGDPWEREAAIKEFYEGRLDVLPDLQPQYVLVGPTERSTYPTLLIRPTWQLVTQVGDYVLYRL